MRIERPRMRCSACGRALPDHAGLWFSGLVATEDGYRRQEFCGECIIRYRDGLFCWWKRRKRPKRVVFDREGALLFFEELTKREVDERLICAMALVLLRRRILKLLEIRHVEDKRLMVLQAKGRRYTVASVPLEDAVLQELRENLVRLFEC